MANKEHLKILKRGVDAWNEWREQILISPDLRWAKLSKSRLSGANLSGANLKGADLIEAHLIGVDLSGADLSGADLSAAHLNGAVLIEADFYKTILHTTSFGKVDLSVAKRLQDVINLGPSTIGVDTIYHSRGQIPEEFLRGAGVPDTFIEYMRSLVVQPIEFYSCFISYSSKDQEFAERLYADLQSKGVRCWYAPEHLKIGDEIRLALDKAIRLRDRLLIVLSEGSINSNWVKREVEQALDEEERRNTTVLFPVRLDESIFEVRSGWTTDVKRRHIGDFRNWKNHNSYKKAFDRLLRDLKTQDDDK